MSEQVWIQIGIYILTGLLAVARVSFIVGRMEAKVATKDELERAKEEGNEKRQRIYSRFDEYKNFIENQFVRRDMCGQMHLTAKDEVKRIDEEYKLFRHEMRNQVQQIFDKIDQLKELIQNGKQS